MFARIVARSRVSRSTLVGPGRGFNPRVGTTRTARLFHGQTGRTGRAGKVSNARKVDIIQGYGDAHQIAIKGRTFPNLWLRDNCRCKQCVNQDTQQRNFDTFLLPEDIHPEEVRERDNSLYIRWSDGHIAEYPWSYVDGWDYHPKKPFGTDESPLFWTSEIANEPPEVKYDAVMGRKDGMAELTQKILVHGFCFVTNSPPEPKPTEDLLKSIGPIRNTHYGGFYDFTPNLALADTAYTNLALPAHTDTTYFSEPAGLQAFHLLSHQGPDGTDATDGPLGGQSLLVDGFNAANEMKKKYPEEYENLATLRVPWHASGNEGITITPDQQYPVIELRNRRPRRIRWNNDDRGILAKNQADEWYAAARIWDKIIRDPKNEYWFQLTPGRILIFDNWRVLHGRSAFDGIRRICGAYINRDDFMSRYRTTNLPPHIVTGRTLHLANWVRKQSDYRPNRDE